jgi:antitoxin component YwqK of YwqJK toxin-antitoxin module
MKPIELRLKAALSCISLAINLFIVSCSGDKTIPEARTDAKKMELEGQVMSVSESVYKGVYSEGEVQHRDLVLKMIYFFDPAGSLTKIKEYDREDIIRRTTTFRYNDRGLIEKCDTNYAGSLEYMETYRYDRKGKRIQMNSIRPPDLNWMIWIYHDEKGNLKKASYQDLVKSQRMSVRYVYDNRGACTEEKYFKADSILVSRRSNDYDESGRLAGTMLYDSRDTLLSKEDYLYNDQGRLSGKTEINNALGMIRSVNFRYDESGRLAEEVTNFNGQKQRSLFKYGASDSKSNWLSRIKIESWNEQGLENLTISIREIKYY